MVIDFLQDALAVSLGGQARRTGPEDEPALKALAAKVGPERLLELAERCLAADEQVERRVQLVLVLEALLDALAQKLAA
jgi:hypothetical protein